MQVTANWQSKDPVAYQYWKNSHFGKHHISNFSVGWWKQTDFRHQTSIAQLDGNQMRGARRPSIEKKILSGHLWEQRNVKEESTTQLFPVTSTAKTCTLLLLSNLVHPEWVPVSCKISLTPNVLCTKEVDLEINMTSISQGCFQFHTMKNGTCFYFFPKRQNMIQATHMSMSSILKEMKHKIMQKTWNVKVSNIQQFHSKEHLCFLFQAVDIFTQYQRHFTEIDAVKCRAALKDYTVFTSEFSQHPLGNNIFHCTDGTFISSTNICDDKADCADRSDEFHCICMNVTEKTHCKYLNNSTTTKECASLFYKSKQNWYNIYKQLMFSETLSSKHGRANKNISTFLCLKLGILLKLTQVDDLVSDCGPAAEDEERLKALLTKGMKATCSDLGEIPCTYGHSKCYILADICVYSLDINNHVSPCRTGTHLAECTDYECHMKYKCPGFYCIEWSLVCDGKWDCPFGFDEEKNYNCNQHRNCLQLYKCKQSTVCIHLGDVCDQIEDCPDREDEQMCDIHKTKCPQMCVCLAFAMKCSHIEITWKELPNTFKYMSVDFFFNI